MTTISGTTGIDRVQDGSVVQGDLAPNVAGNGPCFMGKWDGPVATTAGAVRIAGLTVVADTSGAWNAALSRFTPLVAGYYQCSLTKQSEASGSLSYSAVIIQKNGAVAVSSFIGPYAALYAKPAVSGLIYCNGVSDYIEFWSQDSYTGTCALSAMVASIVLVRAA